jgi:uncharacterized protein (DUF885 family)
MKRILTTLTSALAVAAISIAADASSSEQIAAESKKANDFFEKSWNETLSRHPVDESYYAIKTHYDQLEDLSDEKVTADEKVWERQLADLKKNIKFESLDAQTQLSYKLFEREAAREAEEFKYRFDIYPVSQMRGVHAQIPTFMINIHKIDDVKDAEAYIARLRGFPKLFDQLLVNLKIREEKGVVAPRFVFPLVLDACHKLVQGKPFDTAPNDSPLLENFKKKVAVLTKVDAAMRDRLVADAAKALTESVRPAYEKLTAFLEEQAKRATEDAGVWKFHDGLEFYESALHRTTTTNMSAEEIHETGLKEMARIHEEMNKIREKIGFKGDLQAFFKFMREDQRFRLPSNEQGRAKYLAMATDIIETMKKRLDELFVTKPKADIVVKAVESFREKSAGKAFYQQPAPDGTRPGMFYVNLRDMQNTPTYELEALAHHEGIPGHHMQIAIAQELNGIPKFRKFSHAYTAYIEGWGLYSELTPKEIGLYADPYSDFGRLSLELWRAGRLVVDTGIHDKKWTREQAIDYLVKNTPNTEADWIPNNLISSRCFTTSWRVWARSSRFFDYFTTLGVTFIICRPSRNGEAGRRIAA